MKIASRMDTQHRARRVLVALLLAPGLVADAGAWAGDDEAGATVELPEPADVAAAVSPRSPFAGGEVSITGFLGGGSVAATDAAAEVPCFFCTPYSVQKTAGFDRGNLVALRASKWGGETSRVPGIAFEAGLASGNGSDLKVDFLYLALMPMFRLPLLVTPSLPDGRLNLYAGLGLAVSAGGKATLADTTLPHDVSGDPRGTGTTTVLGARWRQGGFIVSLEHRGLDAGLKFSDFGGGHARYDYDASLYALGLGRAF